MPQRRPPVCIPNGDPRITPVYTGGVPSNALEWHPKTRQRCTSVQHERREDLRELHPGYISRPVQHTMHTMHAKRAC